MLVVPTRFFSQHRVNPAYVEVREAIHQLHTGLRGIEIDNAIPSLDIHGELATAHTSNPVLEPRSHWDDFVRQVSTVKVVTRKWEWATAYYLMSTYCAILHRDLCHSVPLCQNKRPLV